MSRDGKKTPAEEPTAELLPVPTPGRYGDGRRRGFLRRRRAMLPVTLVGASVLLVLMVVLLSVVVPASGPGRIPLGAAPVNTQDTGSAATSDPGSPSGTPSASASVSASASRSASAKPSASTRSAPAGGVVAAAPGGNGAAAGPPTPTPAAPVTFEAESATLNGSAAKATCATCSGGQKVRFVGGSTANYVTFAAVQAPAAGSYRLVITYEVANDVPSRAFDVSANGGAPTAVTATGSTADWTTPNAVTLTVALKAGANSIKVYNNAADAPDLDKITVGG